MVTVGLNFKKIVAERLPRTSPNVKVNNSVNILAVSDSNIADPKKSLIKIEFGFVCSYDPGLGSISLSGELLEMFDKEVGSKIIQTWSNEKKLPKEVLSKVLNIIIQKSNFEAIILSREIGLPSPVAMPKVTVSENPKPGISETTEKTTAKVESKTDSKLDKSDKKKK